MSELKINITEVNGNEIIVRTGSALPAVEPVAVDITGTITAPGDYVEKRQTEISAKDANVVANYTTRIIVLDVKETDPYGALITGKLEVLPDLEAMGINKERFYGEKELLKKLNFFGRYFADREAHTEIVKKLKNFSAKVNKEFVNADDYKGNSAIEKITKIEHEVPLFFVLNMPVFSGFPNLSFKVEINVTVRNAGVEFWLESVELNELMQSETDRIFDGELERLKEYFIAKQW